MSELEPALKVADKTLRVLEYMCEAEDEEFSVTNISRDLDINKTTIFRILQVLSDHGYIKHTSDGRYTIDWRLSQLGGMALNKVSLIKTVRPYLEELSKELKETVNLAVLHDGEVIYIDKIESPNFLRTDLKIGTRVPATNSGLGKAILSTFSEDELNSFLDRYPLRRYTEHSITDKNTFIKDMRITRERGFSIDNEELIPGVRCIGSPIKDWQKKGVAAISIATPSVRMDMDKALETGELLKKIAGDISRHLGYKE
ncbi:MAG: IclR family transcriptional regulator [Thermoanaerobacteraceae bacterium]|nr:IclR family transcriptional regulator [Thermoanaerobacteraceae bacterium]